MDGLIQRRQARQTGKWMQGQRRRKMTLLLLTAEAEGRAGRESRLSRQGKGPQETSYLAVDKKSWPLCLTGPAAVVAGDLCLHQGRLPLKPPLVSLHQASLEHAVWLLAPSQNSENRSKPRIQTMCFPTFMPCKPQDACSTPDKRSSKRGMAQ